MPSSSIATSFRTEKETIDRLDALASSLGRSRNWLVNEAVSDYLAYNEWFVEKVREGMDAATRGDFASDEEIDAVFRTYGARGCRAGRAQPQKICGTFLNTLLKRMPSSQKCGTGYRCRCRYARSLSASWKAWTRSWVKRTSAWQSTVPPRLLGGAPRSRNPAGSAQKTAWAAADDWQALNLSSEAWKPVIQRCRGWQKHAGRAVGDWGERAGLNCTRRGCLRGAESEAQGEAPCGEAAEATAARREGKAPSCGLAGPAQRRLEVRSWRSWQGLPDLLPEEAVSVRRKERRRFRRTCQAFSCRAWTASAGARAMAWRWDAIAKAISQGSAMALFLSGAARIRSPSRARPGTAARYIHPCSPGRRLGRTVPWPCAGPAGRPCPFRTSRPD